MIDNILTTLEHRNIFITGGGGVGKSYTVNKIGEELPLIITASTGVAAVNIGGQTLHAWAGVGLLDQPVESAVARIMDKRFKAKLNCILSADYLVIDEISMVDAYTLDYLNDYLKAVRSSNRPFGDLRVILVGDFFQLPPVGIHKEATKNGETYKVDYCFNSKAWKELKLKTFMLDKVYRQKDKQFIETLNQARHGYVTPESANLLFTRNNKTAAPPIEAVKLFATNKEADYENATQYSALLENNCTCEDGTYEATYYAYDCIRTFQKGQGYNMVNVKLVNMNQSDANLYQKFQESSRVPSQLVLTPGARVMLLYNLDVEAGLVNGSLGTVIRCSSTNVQTYGESDQCYQDDEIQNQKDMLYSEDRSPYFAIVKFDNGITRRIKPETFEVRHNGVVKLSRKQVPLRLAYGITIHKSQGLSLDKVYVDCTKTFAPGQTYVALSRVKSLDGLYLKNLDVRRIFADPNIKKFYADLEKEAISNGNGNKEKKYQKDHESICGCV